MKIKGERMKVEGGERRVKVNTFLSLYCRQDLVLLMVGSCPLYQQGRTQQHWGQLGIQSP